MLTLKHYRRPLSIVSIEGKRVRMTPGLLAKFSKPLAGQNINIYAASHGEYSFSFFVDEAASEKAAFAIGGLVAKSAFEGMSVRKNVGLISVTGSEFINTPGMFRKILSPIAKEKINILQITSSYDSLLLFFDYGDSERAYQALKEYIPDKLFKLKPGKKVKKVKKKRKAVKKRKKAKRKR